MMNSFALLGIFNILIYLGLVVFGIYAVITMLNLMRERNETLKQIRDELSEMK
ncbi:hypothetical protein [Aquibacillus halophilus]|uniref:hypothetical protein n=1 Tax=Aquibacillus halophilus TaxID=930132 RepID=UPI0014785542|nr:hypothetical protein [Aquibacillus halophilus]